MSNHVERDKKPGQKFVLAREALRLSLINRVSTFDNRDPKVVAGEFLNGFSDSEFAVILDCYPPPLDEHKQRLDPFYKTLEGYVGNFFGKRGDLRILRMLFLANRAQIQVGKAISYPRAETEDVLSVPLLNYKAELYFASVLHLDFAGANTHIRNWTLRQFAQDQPVNWAVSPLPSRILYALSGIVSVEDDARRWFYGRSAQPVFLNNNIARAPIPQI